MKIMKMMIIYQMISSIKNIIQHLKKKMLKVNMILWLIIIEL